MVSVTTTYVHTYTHIHTYIRTYVRTYIHTYVRVTVRIIDSRATLQMAWDSILALEYAPYSVLVWDPCPLDLPSTSNIDSSSWSFLFAVLKCS